MNGEQLAAWRNYYQLTQVQLGQLLGVHSVTIARWETGARDIPTYLGLALETVQRELPRKHLKRVRATDPRTPA